MLTAENISKTYQLSKGNATTALGEVSLSFPDRGLVAITGKSGCGKTTLLNILSGVDQPTTGEVKFGGGGNYASFIFQDAQLIDDFTVEENLRLIKRILPETEGDFEKLLEDFGLREVRAHKSNQLSAGQKQRVAIVRAILQNRPVLFADEPTGNLDEKTSGEIASALASRAKERLVIVVTHDYEYFAPYASRKIVMSDGKITQDETIEAAAETVNRGEVGNQKPPMFKWTTAARFAVKGFKKAPVRLALSLVSLFLSLLLALSGLNVLLNDDGAVRYNAFKDEGIQVADLAKTNQARLSDSVPEEEAQNFAEKYGAVTYTNGCNYKIPGAEKSLFSETGRVYCSDSSVFPIKYGKKDIEAGEVVISDYIASFYAAAAGVNDISEVVGRTILAYETPLTISGIFETAYASADEAEKEKFPSRENIEYKASILRKSTYEKAYVNFLKGWSYGVGVYWKTSIRNEVHLNRVISPTNEITITAGDAIHNLQNDEIAISDTIAKELAGNNPADALGKTITINKLRFFSSKMGEVNSPESVEFHSEQTYKIVAVFELGQNGFVVNESAFEEIALTYSVSYPVYGISLPNYSKSQIRALYKLGFEDRTYLAETIDEGQDWVSTLSYVMLVVALVLMIISIITLVNFVGALLSRSKREMGVLMAFGVKKSGIAKIFLLSSIGLVLAAVLLAALAHFAVVAAVNGIMLHFEITLIQYLHYEPLSLLTIIGLMAIIIGIMTAAILAGFRKKSPIDVIYER